MIAVKKSIGPLSVFLRTRTDKVGPIARIVSIVLLCSLLCLPALASPMAKPPNSVAAAVRQDISRREGIPAERLKIQAAIERAWMDGCLGLARPEEICTQSIVNGWLVTVTGDRKTWLYRTDSTGRTIRRER